MSNHLHSLIRTRPDDAKQWSAEEVARRWRTLFPLRRNKGKAAKPNDEEIQAIAGNRVLVALYRERLSSISWFNRCLNENIARRANIEDDCKGRFWEGRFKCQRVLDIAGVLACCAYIDLNPIRAGVSKTLEGSDHTSVQDRIFMQSKHVPVRYKKWPKIPLLLIPEATKGRVTLEEYLKLVDQTGRLVVQGKANITDDISPILERLQIEPSRWLETTKEFKLKFRRVVGPADLIRKAAKKADKFWFHGIRSACRIFRGKALYSLA